MGGPPTQSLQLSLLGHPAEWISIDMILNLFTHSLVVLLFMDWSLHLCPLTGKLPKATTSITQELCLPAVTQSVSQSISQSMAVSISDTDGPSQENKIFKSNLSSKDKWNVGDLLILAATVNGTGDSTYPKHLSQACTIIGHGEFWFHFYEYNTIYHCLSILAVSFSLTYGLIMFALTVSIYILKIKNWDIHYLHENDPVSVSPFSWSILHHWQDLKGKFQLFSNHIFPGTDNLLWNQTSQSQSQSQSIKQFATYQITFNLNSLFWKEWTRHFITNV